MFRTDPMKVARHIHHASIGYCWQKCVRDGSIWVKSLPLGWSEVRKASIRHVSCETFARTVQFCHVLATKCVPEAKWLRNFDYHNNHVKNGAICVLNMKQCMDSLSTMSSGRSGMGMFMKCSKMIGSFWFWITFLPESCFRGNSPDLLKKQLGIGNSLKTKNE